MLGGLHVDTGSDLFDQGDDVAHAQNATGMALGIKHLQAIYFFTGAGKFDGRARDLAHRQSRAAARIAVGFGQHKARQWQGLMKSTGGVDRILALHGIHHKQGLDRVQGLVDLLDFQHQGFIDGQAAGRVNEQHIKVMSLGMLQRSHHDVHWFLSHFTGEPFRLGLGRHRFELLNGRGSIHVGRNREHLFFALQNQMARQLGRGGGFASALQARHQNDRRWLGRQIDIGHALAHGGGQLAVHQADQGLTRCERAHHLLAQGFVFDPGNELAHHGQRHIGLEQSHAHLAQHVGDIGLGDAGLTTEVLDQFGKLVGKCGGHGDSLQSGWMKDPRGRNKAQRRLWAKR